MGPSPKRDRVIVKAGLVKNAKNWKYSSFQHYNESVENSLIDEKECYEHNNKQIDMNFEKKEFFEKGKFIGSPFFRFQFYEKMKRN
ncbi:hypothetical protein MNBD_GAMMA03-2166 [hydrothermal vent metagenome]|uniref:Uncharacterized protein n=1 Tax=hydrothermal vent metagenome TaxID=652676 RepID=A0A3B0WMI0_9ZZZZ